MPTTDPAVQQQPDSPAPGWRALLLALALVLACTNLVELATSMRPHFWERMGAIGLNGSLEHGKLRVGSVDANAAPSLAAVQVGDVVSWDAPLYGFAPAVLNFQRVVPRDDVIELTVEHGGQLTHLKAHAVTPPLVYLVDHYLQVFCDLVFVLVGSLMIYRRSGDKAVRALGVALICWSSAVPLVSASPWFDGLWTINQFTARLWYEVLLVYWAIHLTTSSRWGVARAVVRAWPAWAALTVALSASLSFSGSFSGPDNVGLLQRLADGNHMLLYITTVAALAEGVASTEGAARTRIKWGLFIFGLSFVLFPYRSIYAEPYRADGGTGAGPDIVDYALQLVLPVGLLYATLRHRLLDLGFAINRGLVFAVVSSSLLLSFYGLEKLSEHFIHFESFEQNAMLDGAMALGVFLFFHKVRHRVEHAIEKLFFSRWHKKEHALRLFVSKAVHMTHVAPLLAGYVEAVDRFSDQAGCALYRVGDERDFHRVQGSLDGAPQCVGADDALVVAMRFELHAVSAEELAAGFSGQVAFPMIYRGRVDGFLLLRVPAARDAYRPDEMAVLGFSAQQVGLDLAALEADVQKRRAIELEREAHTLRARAQEARDALELVAGRMWPAGAAPAGRDTAAERLD